VHKLKAGRVGKLCDQLDVAAAWPRGRAILKFGNPMRTGRSWAKSGRLPRPGAGVRDWRQSGDLLEGCPTPALGSAPRAQPRRLRRLPGHELQRW